MEKGNNEPNLIGTISHCRRYAAKADVTKARQAKKLYLYTCEHSMVTLRKCRGKTGRLVTNTASVSSSPVSLITLSKLKERD